MAYTNDTKNSTGSFTNDSKNTVGSGTTWAAVLTTWATETKTWAEMAATSYTNDTKN